MESVLSIALTFMAGILLYLIYCKLPWEGFGGHDRRHKNRQNKYISKQPTGWGGGGGVTMGQGREKLCSVGTVASAHLLRCHPDAHIIHVILG